MLKNFFVKSSLIIAISGIGVCSLSNAAQDRESQNKQQMKAAKALDAVNNVNPFSDVKGSVFQDKVKRDQRDYAILEKELGFGNNKKPNKGGKKQCDDSDSDSD